MSDNNPKVQKQLGPVAPKPTQKPTFSFTQYENDEPISFGAFNPSTKKTDVKIPYALPEEDNKGLSKQEQEELSMFGQAPKTQSAFPLTPGGGFEYNGPQFGTFLQMNDTQKAAFLEKYAKVDENGKKMSDEELKKFIVDSHNKKNNPGFFEKAWNNYVQGWKDDFKNVDEVKGFWPTTVEIAKSVGNRTVDGGVTLAKGALYTAAALLPVSCTKDVYNDFDTEINVNVDFTKLTELLTLISGKLDDINLNIQVGNSTLSKQLNELLTFYKEGKIDEAAFRAQIINLFSQLNNKIDGMGENTQTISKDLKELLKLYGEKGISDKEFFEKINQLLTELRDIGLSTLDALNGFIVKYDKNTQESKENFTKILESLSEIKAGSSDGNAAVIAVLKELMSKYDTNTLFTNDALTNIMSKLDTIIKENKPGDGSSITIEDLKKLIEETYKDPTEMLKSIETLLKSLNVAAGSNITIEDLKKLLEENKTDMGDTNKLIQTVIDQVIEMNKNLGANSTANLEKMMADLIAKYEAGTLSEQDLLKEISGKMDKLVTVDQLNSILDKFSDKLTANSEKYFNELLKELKNISTGVGDTNSSIKNLATIMEKFSNNSTEMKESLTNMEKLIETLIKTNEGNKPLSIEDLKNMIKEIYKDPTEALNNITELLKNLNVSGGSNITLEQLEKLIKDNKVDMTETNDLMKSVITTLNEMNTKLGESGTAALEKLVAELITKYEKGSITQEELLKEISGKMDKLVTVDQLNEILEKFSDKLIVNSEKISKEMLDKMEKILQATGNNTTALNELKALMASFTNNSNEMKESMTNMEKLIETLIKNNEGNKPLSIEDLKAMIKEIYKDPTEALNNITELLKSLNVSSGNNITLEQLEKLIKDNKVDMKETNDLLKSMVDKLTVIEKNTEKTGNESNLDKIMAEFMVKVEAGMMSIEDVLKEMSKKMDSFITIDDITNLLDNFYAKTSADNKKNHDELLNAVKNNTTSINDLKDIFKDYQTTSNSMVDIMNKIGDKIDVLISQPGGGSLTVEDLEKLIKENYKDPTPLLEEIKNLLGNINSNTSDQITLAQLTALLKANQVNLSETNKLIADLIKAVEAGKITQAEANKQILDALVK